MARARESEGSIRHRRKQATGTLWPLEKDRWDAPRTRFPLTPGYECERNAPTPTTLHAKLAPSSTERHSGLSDALADLRRRVIAARRL